MTLQPLTDRQQLRRSMRAQRRSLTPLQQRIASLKLKEQLQRSPAFMGAGRVAVYLASDGEINPKAIIDLCWKLNKKVYLPVLHPVRHNRLWFTPYTPNTRLSLNRYKILEPVLKRHGVSPWALDLVLMPLVAFDAEGGRMGMGGGYYDRTFAFKLSPYGLRGPKLVGLAHDFQRVEALPLADWDVPLTGIVSDQRRYKV